MMNPLALETQGLSIQFGAFKAVSDVNLSVEVGARHALIGPNGAGKTTLINLLTGVLKPSQGHILLNGQNISRLPMHQRVRLGLSRTFQINTLFNELTPLASVVLAISEREKLGMTWWKPVKHYSHLYDEAHLILKQLKLDHLALTPVDQMAYGKQRLLEMALSLAAKPKVLLLDEPAAGIPEDESGEMFEVIEQLPSDMSILFIEHDMRLVFRFAKRISVLVSGAILTENSPEEIANDPRVRAVYLGGANA